MARFYSNENFPLKAVRRLRELGHDVLTTQEAGKADQAIPDEDVVAYARENQRCVLTLNRRDFMKLHQKSSHHAGIVVCTSDADFIRLADNVHAATTQVAKLTNQLVRVVRGT